MNILDSLALKYGTDKSSSWHNYAEKYDEVLCSRRESTEKVLEIGVHNGASLRMWRDYFPNAEIYGVDIKEVNLQEQRITTFVGNQGTSSGIDAIWEHGPYDIIIDDGSHKWDDQIFTFAMLLSAKSGLKPGGIYIVEDVHTSYEPWIEEYGDKKISCVEYFKCRLDNVNFNGLKVDESARRESLLIPEATRLGMNTDIESIHFLNSIIIIHKRR